MVQPSDAEDQTTWEEHGVEAEKWFFAYSFAHVILPLKPVEIWKTWDGEI
jgi:hypothetical protein